MPDISFEVALSYASEDRTYVNRVWKELSRLNHKVFYDQDPQCNTGLLGRELVQEFDVLFREKALIIVLFLSEAYFKKHWTTFEMDRAKLGQLQAALLKRSKLIVPVFMEPTIINRLPTPWPGIGGFFRKVERGQAYREVPADHIARGISRLVSSLTDLDMDARGRVLLHFVNGEYHVAAELMKSLLSRPELSARAKCWCRYNLACCLCRMAESTTDDSTERNALLDEAVKQINAWWINTREQTPLLVYSQKEGFDSISSDANLGTLTREIEIARTDGDLKRLLVIRAKELPSELVQRRIRRDSGGNDYALYRGS